MINNMWIARDTDGTLKGYNERPIREGTWWQIRHYLENEYYQDTIILDRTLFPNLTWEDEPVEVVIKDKLLEDVIANTTQGVTKKELIKLLADFPDDAKVVIECCNVKHIGYCEKDNTIRID